uniref:Putative secreted protein n=1 Tax=Ixodes ricinus TaxID=34613 RepID=A0A6B0UFM2_IXORI
MVVIWTFHTRLHFFFFASYSFAVSVGYKNILERGHFTSTRPLVPSSPSGDAARNLFFILLNKPHFRTVQFSCSTYSCKPAFSLILSYFVADEEKPLGT